MFVFIKNQKENKIKTYLQLGILTLRVTFHVRSIKCSAIIRKFAIRFKKMLDKLIIAVDFDGTIVEDAYPEIGEAKIFAFDTMKRLQKDGHRLILWTYRHGKRLDEAVAFCKENGIEFYAVNKNYNEEVLDDTIPRKLGADIFIDDRNIGGFIGWGEIYQQLTKEEPPKPQKKGGLFSFLKGS